MLLKGLKIANRVIVIYTYEKKIKKKEIGHTIENLFHSNKCEKRFVFLVFREKAFPLLYVYEYELKEHNHLRIFLL